VAEDDERGGELAAGSAIGRYVVQEQIRDSPVTRAYRALEPRLERNVVVQVARGADAERLRDDARRIAGVTHPGVVPVLASGTHGEDGYVVVPDLQAVSLREYVAGGTVDSVVATRIVVDLAQALQALSEAGVRVVLDLDSALVTRAGGRDSGMVDPFPRTGDAAGRLVPADAAASIRELGELLAALVRQPDAATGRAIAAARAGALTTPAELAAALAPARLSRPRRLGRTRAAAVVTAALALAVAATFLVLGRGGGHPHPQPLAVASPPARLVARVALGLGKKETPSGVAFSGGSAWITTSAGRLVQVDTATNEVVGAPLTLDTRHRNLSGLATGDGSLWIASDAGWLFRVDPATRRVTGKLELATYLNPPVVSGGVVWLTRSPDVAHDNLHGQLFRVAERTMQQVGTLIRFAAYPIGLQVQGSRAWVLGYRDGVGSVTRIDTSTGRQLSLNVAQVPEAMSLRGRTLWVTSGDGAISSIDATAMTLRGGVARVEGIAGGVDAGARDVWVTYGDSLDSGAALSLARVDPSSSGLAGRPATLRAAAVGITDGRVTATSAGVWVIAQNELLRLSATSPRTAPAPIEGRSQPYPLAAGPLGAGRWRTRAFAVPASVSVPSLRWIATRPQGDDLNFVPVAGAGREVDILAPRQVWVTDTQLRAIDGAEHLYAQLRSNPKLVIANVQRLHVGGRPAIRFTVRIRTKLASAALCGAPCVPIFPLQITKIAAGASDAGRFTVLDVGKRTIVILESGPRPLGHWAEPLLGTLRFG